MHSGSGPGPGAAEVIINHSGLQNPRDLPCKSSECLLVTFWGCEQGHLISFCVISLSDTVWRSAKKQQLNSGNWASSGFSHSHSSLLSIFQRFLL